MKELIFEDKEVNYWFTSDSHYWHKNIVKGESSWKDKDACRDFATRKEMSDELVHQINKHVGEYDILFHLGDWSFGGIQNIWNFRKRINCKNIFLCTGNHDHHIKENKVLPNCHYSYVGRTPKDGKPPGDIKTESEAVRAQELFTKVAPMFEVKVLHQRMTLSHYCMLTYYFHNKGAWMLYGHSHDSLHIEGKSLDVGVDTAFRLLGEYRPFSLSELNDIMKTKDIHNFDHHNFKTNAR